MLYFVLFLALIWGSVWALFLQFVPFGRWLVRKRTWMTVVAGVGVDLALAKLIVPWEWWWPVAAIVGASAVGIVMRSLINEWAEWAELLRGIRAETEGSKRSAGK